ncbi:MAG: hypothetical protein FJY75_04375 [Candidatus Eisenbacteria bacterium]|uniref:D-glucuronyl C5-epimerase C-terminal domain-containing protein n=1 Tax=Eiseniibacteriota bacterium TaxID=2212470 RepID=A0A938BQB7_UNCEI|nr:hypothetical protein [Candidatus Eisenbacteria bacterium]
MRGARRRGLRGAGGRAALLAACALAAAALGLAAQRFWVYTQGYPRTRFLPESVDAGPPRHFYLDWRRAWQGDAVVGPALAEDGIFRGARDVRGPGGILHDPVRVVQASLALHGRLLDRPDPALAEVLRRQVDWVAGEGLARGPGGWPVWPQRYDFPRYGLTAPWISALTQGQAISLLVRAADYFAEPRYAEVARGAAAGLLEPGSPLAWRDGRGLFFEEFPCLPPAHALNGCLLAWLGLWDWVRWTGDPELEAKSLGILRGISERIPEYERHGWTRYDLLQRRPTSPAYHELHAALAEALAAVSGEPAWADRAARWGAQARSPLRRAWVGAQVLAAKAGAGLRLRPAGAPPRERE